jgi:RNA dependent RNA polymerase
LKDVVVFSTKGEVPLAHLLSGGDYDGDIPWICWDQDVVQHFQNTDMPEMPSKRECGLVQHSRKIKDVFSQGTSRRELAAQVDGFFAGCFAFNLNPSLLGNCTSEHERLVYADGNLCSPHAIKLATLSGYLVDSAKQGDLLTASAWHKIRKQVSPRTRESPAYKDEKRERYKRESNVIDYLKFWQAVPEKERILRIQHSISRG